MTPDTENATPGSGRAGWTAAKPATLASPTWLPAATAFGITLLFWGLISSTVIVIAGASVVTVSLVGWIAEMRHER